MGSELTLLVGHRGVGKTTFLKRQRGFSLFDLDAEITHRHGEQPGDIIRRSEAEFRALEQATLRDILSTAHGPTIIALGAGFEGPPPAGAHVLWLRRSTDASGRSFLNRPRLDTSVSPFDEYMARYPLRQQRFRHWAHEELWLPEGGAFNGEVPHALPYDLTLLPENMRDWENFWAKRRHWGLRRLELREDLLTPEQIARVRRDVDAQQILYTCRNNPPPPDATQFDWPLEMGRPAADASVVSLHELREPFAQALPRLESHAAPLLKLAAPVATFRELQAGHAWWLRDPQRRAFLPRSADGRWRWYRSLFGPRMPLHFLREGEGSSLDQPYLYQTVLQKPLREGFAAVLGHPVEHSRSPMEHLDHALPFVAIDVSESEWPEAIEVLTALGLQAAAVTSPLKALAGGVNTLVRDHGSWSGLNTDILALKQIHRELTPPRSAWVWGQGALLESIKSVWPHAESFSARAGSDRVDSPDLLIWATGRGRPFRWPMPSVRPRLVLDLNYGDDSPGLEFAVMHGLPYQSGLQMFKLQAAAQKEFWQSNPFS